MTELQIHLGTESYLAALRRDVRAGLTAKQKSLPPKYFYDERGSRLFDEITRLPEYYPTRAETKILRAHAEDIALSSRVQTLVELGSGTSEKTRVLLRALNAVGTLERFTPFDVDPVVLSEASGQITDEYPTLTVVPVVGDFEEHLDVLGPGDHRMIAFLGSTIGNLEPGPRARFLAAVADTMGEHDTFLLGTDLVKDPARLQRAYDDPAGVTAAFNKNVLAVVNQQLGADFDLEAFEHVVLWDARQEWIEMRLRSTRAQTVTVADLDLRVPFANGEHLRTEVSAKFRPARLTAELADAGLRTSHRWTDPDGDFALTLARLQR